MAAGPLTQIADLLVPAIWDPYIQQLTERKTRLVASGAVARSSKADSFLAGAGVTFNMPSFKDLDSDADNVSDDTASTATPAKIGSGQEIAVRLSRNQSWGAADLDEALIGPDPLDAIAQRVSTYRAGRAQAAFVSEMTGVFLDNAAAPTGSDTHTQNDMLNNLSILNGSVFADGVTNFSTEAFIDAALTMGDSMDDLQMVMVHSVVYARMLKNNLIDFVSDSSNPQAQRIATFLGREVIVDDTMPVAASVYDTWLFGRGAVIWGQGSPKVPVEVQRNAMQGNGGGTEYLINRWEWLFHPVGHAFLGTSTLGGPTNANLALAASWSRRYAERKMIKIARLVTREA